VVNDLYCGHVTSVRGWQPENEYANLRDSLSYATMVSSG